MQVSGPPGHSHSWSGRGPGHQSPSLFVCCFCVVPGDAPEWSGLTSSALTLGHAQRGPQTDSRVSLRSLSERPPLSFVPGGCCPESRSC